MITQWPYYIHLPIRIVFQKRKKKRKRKKKPKRRKTMYGRTLFKFNRQKQRNKKEKRKKRKKTKQSLPTSSFSSSFLPPMLPYNSMFFVFLFCLVFCLTFDRFINCNSSHPFLQHPTFKKLWLVEVVEQNNRKSHVHTHLKYITYEYF